MRVTGHRVSSAEYHLRIRDERDQLRKRLDAFERLLDAAESGGDTVVCIKDIRCALKIGAHR